VSTVVEVQSTWEKRDLPFLAEALNQLEASEVDEPGITAIAQGAGLTEEEGLLAARALHTAGYITMRWMERGAGPPIHGMVRAVSGEARRAVGSWPSADAMLAELVDALRDAAERESDPEKESSLRKAAEVIGGMARDIAVGVLTKQIGG